MGQIKPLDYHPTHPGATGSPFTPERIAPHRQDAPRSTGARTLQLAVPAGWTLEAACVGQYGAFDSEHLWQRAKAICASCPVATACLTAALAEESETGIRFGVRGGLTAAERGRLDNLSSEGVVA